MYDFTKKKFLALTYQRQHKKCAEILRQLYNQEILQEDTTPLWLLYQEFLQWMKDPYCEAFSIKSVADRYHWHRQQAHISKKEHHFLPTVRKGDRSDSEETWPIAIYLDHLRSAHNVGSILRTTEAFALGSLYFSSQTPFIEHKQVQDAAMGTIKWLSCNQGVSLSTLPRPIVVLETTQHALPLYEFKFPLSFTLVVGNEEYGCSDETLHLADHFIEIPLRGHKNSLNVANAFAIVASEIYRQKNCMLKEYDDKKK